MQQKLFRCLLIVCFAGSVLAQATKESGGVSYPTEQQIANFKRIYELWRHPTFVTLRLVSMRREVPNEEPSTTPSPYTIDQWLHFELFITQNLTESLVIENVGGPYYQYRPELIRDADIVPYSQEVQEQVAKAEREVVPRYGSVFSTRLVPGRESQRNLVNLEDWYELPLPPGHYQLIVRKQFVPDGDRAESNPVTFDVVPRDPPSPIPDGLNVKLTPESAAPLANGSYHLGYTDSIAIDLINDSDERVQVKVIDRIYGHRPQLTKDGQLIPYRDDVAKMVDSKEKDPRLVELSPNLFLDPHTTSRLDGFSLSQWYGPLGPGVYHLTYRRRFEIAGPWSNDSPEIVFEIR